MAIQSETEYKALRDEMISLFHRVFIIFGAELGAIAILTINTLSTTGLASKCTILILIDFLLGAGILLTIGTYTQIYNIGSYIVVYFEDEQIGWHTRSRHTRLKLEEYEMQAPLKYLDKVDDPTIIGFGYSLLLFASFVLTLIHLTQRWFFFIPLLGTLLLIFLLGALVNLYKDGSQRWMNRWMQYKAKNLDQLAKRHLNLENK